MGVDSVGTQGECGREVQAQTAPSGGGIDNVDTFAERLQKEVGASTMSTPLLRVKAGAVSDNIEANGKALVPRLGFDNVETQRELGQEADEAMKVDLGHDMGEELSVLYLVAGMPRKGDVRFYLEREARRRQTTLRLQEVDCKRGGGMDLLNRAT